MRLSLRVILAAGLVLVVTSCGKKEQPGTGGQEPPAPSVPGSTGTTPPSIEGTYLIIGIDFNGEKMPDAELAKDTEAERTIVLKGNKFISKMGGKTKEEEFKTDSTGTPARIDFTTLLSGGKSQTQFGIYKIEGDTLTIAVNNDPQQPPKDRPKDFNSNKESFIMILKRK